MASDPRGQRIPEYLATFGEQLGEDQRMTLEELASLRENLEHIKDTVAMQQSYAKLLRRHGNREGRRFARGQPAPERRRLTRHGVTAAARVPTTLPRSRVDKHKVLQILVNLVRNAKYACDESGRTDKRITLRSKPAAEGVRISVIDNGVGIAGGKHEPPVQSRLHDAQIRARFRPAQRRARRTRSRRHAARAPATDPATAPHSFSSFRTRRRMPPVREPSRAPANRRILIIDDNAAIHQDFRKVLAAQAEHSAQAAFDILEADIFATRRSCGSPGFRIDSAHQGQEGVAMARCCRRRRAALCHGIRRHAHAARLGRTRDHRAPVGR